jgi:hypothetical protein
MVRCAPYSSNISTNDGGFYAAKLMYGWPKCFTPTSSTESYSPLLKKSCSHGDGTPSTGTGLLSIPIVIGSLVMESAPKKATALNIL